MSNAIVPRTSLDIRSAVAGDVWFIDKLRDLHGKAMGFMPLKEIEGKISAGQVLIAEVGGLPVGYCIAQDRYFKRDDLGIIYALNVAPTAHRRLIGASLIKATFDRAAYGCKLFCCWVAQDLNANHFWESIGFLPLAFRAGAARGKVKPRAHIFWQRRIRQGDTTTPFWFPSKTDGGMMREERLVLPIPPGVHWSSDMPILLPQEAVKLPRQRSKGPGWADPTQGPIRMCRGQFAPASRKPKALPYQPPEPEKPVPQKLKANPAHVAAVRELRDRHLERFNSGHVLPQGKYDVSRQIEAAAQAPMALNAAPLLLEQKAA
jgi:hypothetical protein